MRVHLTLCVALLSGCTSINNSFRMDGLEPPSQSFVADRTPPDDYPGFAAGQGNIYSCRYGISHVASSDYSPPKAEMFAALLAQAKPAIAGHRVVLERFDVYINQRLIMLNDAGKFIGGGAGSVLQGVGDVNKDVFAFEKLLVDSNPAVKRHPEENLVGCDDEGEGEYYASEISGGHSVIVTWLKFTVDDRPYHFRTYYQFQAQTKERVLSEIPLAIRMSIRAASVRIDA